MGAIAMPRMSSALPLGAIPSPSPRWFPVTRQWIATMSPCAKDVLDRDTDVGKSLAKLVEERHERRRADDRLATRRRLPMKACHWRHQARDGGFVAPVPHLFEPFVRGFEYGCHGPLPSRNGCREPSVRYSSGARRHTGKPYANIIYRSRYAASTYGHWSRLLQQSGSYTTAQYANGSFGQGGRLRILGLGLERY
jgi:hypothetical protein